MPDNLLYVERPEYTGIAIAYKNRDFIADMVMPRRSFGAKAFKYIKFNKADRFTPQDTKIGRTSYPNQVEFGGTEVDGRVTDYGLESFVSNEEIKLFSETYDPLGNATELVSELVALGREKRVAGVVFNAGTYATANKTTLSGNDQWSDYSNSDPVEKILESLDALLVRPNKGVFGRPVWTKLRKHPKVVSKVLGSVNASGLVTRQALAEALELDEIIVGTPWYNSAKAGQTESYAELWGKHAAFIYQSPGRSEMTFGFTAEFDTRRVKTAVDERRGVDGSTAVRVIEQIAEVTPATDLGYFFQNAVA
jgi:hypothetical protein